MPLTVIQFTLSAHVSLDFQCGLDLLFRVSRLLNEKVCYKLLNKVYGISKCPISGTPFVTITISEYTEA